MTLHTSRWLASGLLPFRTCKKSWLALSWRAVRSATYWTQGWCAASSQGLSGDVIAAKWLSVIRHIQNMHTDHSYLFPTCAHSELDYNRKWFKPNTLAFQKLSNLLTNTRLITDVKKLSPLRQTSSVEAFHSLIIQFAPKSAAFSFKSMMTRLLLAALHYNENSDRKQACNARGVLTHSIRFPSIVNERSLFK